MWLRVHQVKLDISEDEDLLKQRVADRLDISPGDILMMNIVRKSIDARNKNRVFFVYSVDVKVSKDKGVFIMDSRDVQKTDRRSCVLPSPGDTPLKHKPIIIGTGPAGLFAGLILAKAGYSPIILERGKPVDDRVKDVRLFWDRGELNPESNVQFGEGGAGTFSDGKLTTRIKDLRCRLVLQEFVRCGASPEILYESKPHLGTDTIRSVVKKLRSTISSLGGEIRFNSKVTGIDIKEGRVRGVVVNDKEFIPCEVVIAAVGNSARDTYAMMKKQGISINPKSFAIGVRIEHHQRFIDKSQYGKFAGHPKLGAADYRLAYTERKSGRGVYTFCMCPGGYVIASASEPGTVVTNGMSYHDRGGENANSAVVVTVHPKDFYSGDVLDGINFQRELERKAFRLGGENYSAPCQKVEDFLNNRPSESLGKIKPTYKPGVALADINKCLPGYVLDMLKKGLKVFDRRIKGFASEDSIITGVETRTSSSVRIVRRQDYQSENTIGLYPVGEGAGYAGGIISAAVDGIKGAENIIETFSPPKE